MTQPSMVDDPDAPDADVINLGAARLVLDHMTMRGRQAGLPTRTARVNARRALRNLTEKDR